MVIVYSTPTCMFCDAVCEMLDKSNIQYEVIDITKTEVALEEFLKKTGQMSVPVIEYNGKFIVGYREREIQKMIGELSEEM